MKSYVPGWTTLAENPLVLLKDYSFGPGRANALAVALPGGSILIMSPPRHFEPKEAEAFRAIGPVVALVENNGSHHLGLAPARACFPEAVTYAAPRAAARIRKKSKDFGELQAIDTLRPRLGDKVSLVEVEGDKIGDVIMHVRSERGVLLYASDFLANIPELPRNPLFRLIFKLTDSGPGLKVFNMFFKLYVADPKKARRCLIRELQANAPTILVPAHGDVVAREDLTATLVSMLEAAS